MATSNENSTKIGFGDETKLQGAVENNTLDAHDLALTTNDQLYYIDKDKNLKRVKPRIETFEDVEAAIAYINHDPFTESRLGQPLSIKNGQGYDLYLIESDGDKYTVTKKSNIVTGLTWIEL